MEICRGAVIEYRFMKANMNRENALRNQILQARHAYYYRGESLISDAEYDALEDELRRFSPDDPVLALVGAPVPADSLLTKARHAMPMGSQGKVNSAQAFRDWCTRAVSREAAGGAVDSLALNLSLKADGASAAAYYRSGQLIQVISRGDGVVGEDITANALRFKGLPAWADDPERPGSGFTGAVRFEVILTVADWTLIDPARSKNPRNAGAGIMGRKNGHQSEFLTAFAFDIDESRDGEPVFFDTEREKAARLTQLGFNLIAQQQCVGIDQAIAYFEHVAATRDVLPMWIDGVVIKFDDIAVQRALGVTSGRPKGQVAWKFDSSGEETVLLGVVVTGGHTGGLYPTAQLAPVEIGGTTVSSASLANYDEILRLDVAIGDSVWVVKANDIIPKIIRVTDRPASRIPIVAPSVCPFCSAAVGRRRVTSGEEGVIIECLNADCVKKSTGKIGRWIASLDILGIGDVVLEAMIDQLGLADAADLYTLHQRRDALAALVTHAGRDLRLGEKRAASILAAIDASRSLSLSQFLGSLGLTFLGKRRVALMIDAAGGQLSDLDAWRCGQLREASFAAQAGVPGIGSQIQDAIDAVAELIDRLLAAGVSVQTAQIGDTPGSATADAALGATVCISGKLPSGRKKSDYAEPLRRAGYRLVDDVRQGLNFLVQADADSVSGKAGKAARLGIKVISEAALMEMVGDVDAERAIPPPPLPSSPALVQVMPAQNRPVPPQPLSDSVENVFQRFEFIEGTSSKFWEIRAVAVETQVRYGRIGSQGQLQIKEFTDARLARAAVESQITKKLKDGYRAVADPDVFARKTRS